MKSVVLFLLCPILSFSTYGFSWGHFPEINSSRHMKEYLFAPVIERKEIKYCIEEVKPRFSIQAIARETEAALKAWLQAIYRDDLTGTSFQQVSCEDDILDLGISLTDKVQDREGSYPGTQVMRPKPSQRLSFLPVRKNIAYVKLNTEAYAYKDRSPQRLLDTLQFFGDSLSVEDWLSRAFLRREAALTDYLLSQNQNPYFQWTFPTLLHEIGHAFGLCDQYPEGLSSCDKNWENADHPESVMRYDTRIELSPDDREGINRLYDRFADKFKSRVR